MLFLEITIKIPKEVSLSIFNTSQCPHAQTPSALQLYLWDGREITTLFYTSRVSVPPGGGYCWDGYHHQAVWPPHWGWASHLYGSAVNVSSPPAHPSTNKLTALPAVTRTFFFYLILEKDFEFQWKPPFTHRVLGKSIFWLTLFYTWHANSSWIHSSFKYG